MFFNKNINYLVKSTEINQNQLAAKMGITRQSVNRIIKSTNPQISTVLKICEIYKLTIDELIFKDLETERTKTTKWTISVKI